MTSTSIPVSSLRLDGGTQPRVQLDYFVIDEYAHDMRAGAIFPPVIAFYDGTDYWLADGFHRVKAAESAELLEIAVDVRQGTRRDAVLYSVGANAEHGKKRSNEDKRQAVRTLLSDPEWAQWSDREIARATRTDHVFVGKLRLLVSGDVTRYDRKAERGGTVYTLDTSRIGTTARIAPEARALLRDTPLAEDQRELAALAKKTGQQQLAIAERLAVGDVRTVAQAATALIKDNAPVLVFPVGKYAVICADPPWSYANSGLAQSAASHYPTMPTDEICRLDVPSLCTPDTVLFLWATSPLLPDALTVLQAWGFEYKAGLIWDKGASPGIGWFVQTEHEHLLIATRTGNPHPLVKPKSVLHVAPSSHSAKPDEAYRIIESMYGGPYLEMFARSERENWTTWGNEI